MAEGQIVVELILDDGQILKALGKVKQEAKDTKDELEKDSGGGFFSKKIGDLSVGFVALGAAALKTFDLLKGGFDTAVAAARESQKALDDLSSALALNGQFTTEAVSNFEKFAGTLEKQTGINDDIITQNASLLVSFGKLSGEGLEKATKAAIDFSAATGKDLGTSFDLIAKAAAGNVEALGRYGIKVDQSIPKAERFAVALEQLQKKFGGLAEQRADTFEGTINKLENAFDSFAKAFGNLIVKSPVVRAVLKTVADIVEDLTEKMKGFSAQAKFDQFLRDVISFGRGVVAYVVKPIEIVFNSLVTGTSVIATAFFGLANIFAKVHNWLIEFLIAPITNFFGETLGNFVSKFAPEMGQGIKDAFSGVSTTLIDVSKTTVDTIGNLYESSLATTIDAANTTFDTTASNAIDSVLEKVETAANKATVIQEEFKNRSVAIQEELATTSMTVGMGFAETLNGFDAAAKDFANSAQANFRKVGQAMFQSVGNAAGQAFAAFGKAVAQGDNALKAFLNSLLASFGQMAIQLGTQFILQGIAYSWAGMPNGPSLIAAGAALAAFGGVLSALGGGGGASAGAGAAGGGAGGISSSESPTAQLAAPELARPQDKITVNIQGDVLDSDETGGRIVRLLTEYSDKNGNGAVVT